MQRLLFLLLISTVLISCNQSDDTLVVFKNNQLDYKILISSNFDSLSQQSAEELGDYLFKITRHKPEIVFKQTADQKYFVIGDRNHSLLGEMEKPARENEDAFYIGENNQNIYLLGTNGKTQMYAVYTFLEEYLNCRYLNPNEEFVPESDKIEIQIRNKLYEPAFSFRRALFPARADEKYRLWHKLEELDDWGMFVHTFQHLVPPDKYFDEHPEYFSLVNGRRLQDGQLCLSNQNLLDLLAENLKARMDEDPYKHIWSVSQNDCYNYCECEECQAMYDKYESYSGAYIYMSNYLAKLFPDKTISTLAYQFTRSAPINIKPLENVNIMFCSIECNRSMPLAEDERSKSFVKDMKDWSALTHNIFMWDYVVQFKNYMCPFPNFHVIQPNIQFYREHGVDLMFQQGSGGNWSDLSELKQYYIAKLLWNPELNGDSLINDFMHHYYGKAAPLIREYFDLMHANLIRHQKETFLNIYGFPMDYRETFLTPDLLIRYKEIMDKAEALVSDAPTLLNRIQKTRLAVDFAYLDIALNAPTPDISYIKDGVLDTSMMDYLDRYVELCEKTNTPCINERAFKPMDYRSYAKNKINMMLKSNLAKNATVTIKTTYSEKYPVGGAQALTDGLFGDLDYHNNWLGFEGYDMVVEINFSELTEVNKVNMNFLKAVNSWVFQPKEVFIEISQDGKNYQKAGTVNGDNSDRNYLVKSIPFEIPIGPVNASHLRITAISLKECPEWHRGFGKPSWIFVDEIVVE